MKARGLLFVAMVALLAGNARVATAQLRITLPKRSKATPVQKLNQQGVGAVQKHDYEKAKKLFYEAYLLDPDDPFTLNNLGYIAELDGQIERAQRFYALSAEHASQATIARSNTPSVEGKAIAEIAGKTDDKRMLVNRYNLEGIGLLAKNRAPEADMVFQKALRIEPENPFTLNNLGFAKEKQGEMEEALALYRKAANGSSSERILVTPNREWQGKEIARVAAQNADKLRKLMRNEQTVENRVGRLNLQGVSALNRNEPELARRFFEQAYKLQPTQAFTLNNLGYVAELEGDRESAEFYYAKAREAEDAGRRVDIATREDAEGKRLREVAEDGEQQIQTLITRERQARRAEGSRALLRTRDGQVVVEPERPPEPLHPEPTPQAAPPPAEQQDLLMPLPDEQQPDMPAQSPPPPSGGLLMPLPEAQQPASVRDNASPQP